MPKALKVMWTAKMARVVWTSKTQVVTSACRNCKADADNASTGKASRGGEGGSGGKGGGGMHKRGEWRRPISSSPSPSSSTLQCHLASFQAARTMIGGEGAGGPVEVGGGGGGGGDGGDGIYTGGRRPLWDRMVTICKRLWGESLQCRMVRVGVSQCLIGGCPNLQGTDLNPVPTWPDFCACWC
jgi:hypothetical protein